MEHRSSDGPGARHALFLALRSQHTARVEAYLRAIPLSPSEREDLRQDVWGQVFLALDVALGAADVGDAVIAIARAVVGDHRDATRRLDREQDVDAIAAPPQTSGDVALFKDALDRWTHWILERMTARQRDVLWCRRAMRLSVRETAVFLGMKEGTVGPATRKAEVRFRELAKRHPPPRSRPTMRASNKRRPILLFIRVGRHGRYAAELYPSNHQPEEAKCVSGPRFTSGARCWPSLP